MSFKDASGKVIEDRGKYVTIWERQKDGTWKVAVDICNSDLATPSAAGQLARTTCRSGAWQRERAQRIHAVFVYSVARRT